MPFVTDLNELPEALYRTWHRLALTTDQGDPVCCAPAWNLAYHLVSDPDSRIFHLSDNDSLVLFTEHISLTGEVYLYPVESGWMFGKNLLGFFSADLLAQALEEFSREYNKRLPYLVLSGIQRFRPETARLYNLHSGIYDFYRHDSTVQCSASLAGGLDGWLGRRSANHRAKLKKAARKAKALGVTYERRRPESRAEALEIYSRMLAVEAASWKGHERCGITESPSLEFYETLITAMAETASTYIIFCRHEDRDIGFIFGGSGAGIYRGQQFSYDRAYGDYSIGNLMQLEKIKWLCELGFRRYDMGPITGPRMNYKEHWTEERREIETWVLRKKN